MELTRGQRKQEYIDQVLEEYKPIKQKWWKSTETSYHSTQKLAKDNYKRLNRVGPVEFKKGKTGAIVGTIIFVASVLGFFFIDKIIGFFAFIALVTFLALLLPRLLDKKVRIRITRNGIWVEGLAKEISWDNVLLTYLKEVVVNDTTARTFILHFYDPASDQFLKIERRLDEISAFHLAATIEYYRSEYIPAY